MAGVPAGKRCDGPQPDRWSARIDAGQGGGMMWRRIGGSLAGACVTIAAIMAIEALGHRATGAPADPAEATTPMLLWVLAAWTLGTILGAIAGVKLARWRGAAWPPAILVVVGVLATALSLPSPWWLTGAGIALPLLSAALIGRRSAPADQRVAL